MAARSVGGVPPHSDEVNAALARTLYERYDEVTIGPDHLRHRAQHVVSSHPDSIVWEEPAG